jgi:hypothetical protein
MKDPQFELEHLRKLGIILEDGMMLALLRRHFTGEPDTGTTRPSGSEGAGRKRTLVMVQRAALRPYLDGLEAAVANQPHRGTKRQAKLHLIRFADDFVRHEARYVHGARAPTIGRRVVSLSP